MAHGTVQGSATPVKVTHYPEMAYNGLYLEPYLDKTAPLERVPHREQKLES